MAGLLQVFISKWSQCESSPNLCNNRKLINQLRVLKILVLLGSQTHETTAVELVILGFDFKTKLFDSKIIVVGTVGNPHN